MESLTLSQPKEPRHEVLIAATGSILCHGLVLAMVFLLPAILPKPTYRTPYYSVNLVSEKELGLGSGTLPKGKQHSHAAVANHSKRSRAVSSNKVKATAMVPVKRLQFDKTAGKSADRIRKLNVPEMPELAKSSENNSVLDRKMDQLISKPKLPAPSPPPSEEKKASSASESSQSSTDTSHNAAGGSSVTSRSATGGQIGLARRLYYTEVWSAIRSQWALPEFLKSQKLEVVLVLTVRRDGKIIAVRFEKKSGNTLFDESALRAVRKANPLPPFPKIYNPPEEQIGIRFRPEDLG